jgi:hypothetical protein
MALFDFGQKWKHAHGVACFRCSANLLGMTEDGYEFSKCENAKILYLNCIDVRLEIFTAMKIQV